MTTTWAYPPIPKVNRKQMRLPPGPTELPLLGQALRYLSDIVGLMQEAATYGDLATMSVKPALVYLLAHPDLIHEVFVRNQQKVGRGRSVETLKYLLGDGLVTADGPLHSRQRRLMQPQFYHKRIVAYSEIMRDYAIRHSAQWTDGTKVDMAEEMSNLTLHIVVKTLFGLKLPDEVRRIGNAFEISNDYVTVRANQPSWVSTILHRMPLPFTRKFRNQLAYLDATVYGLIEQRRQTGTANNDLLSLLLQVRDHDVQDPDGGVMTDRQVRDETITLFAAGHETTAVALAWTWYLLATHEEIQERFHDELTTVLAGKPPGPEDLPQLQYTEQILTESMRLYPPIWSIARMTYQPLTLEGYKIPAGAILTAPPLLVHRDPRWYEHPLEFQPARWTTEFREQLPKFAFFPFGGGPRVCIGAGFSWLEAKLLLATLGQKWRMRPDPAHRIELQPLVSLRCKGGMPMFLERRN